MDRELQDKSLARRLLPSPARSPSNPRLKKNCIQRTFAPMEVGSLRAAIFTYCSSIIGAGVLSIPYAMHLCGLGLGIIMLIAGALIFTIFYWVLCDCCDHLEIYDYDALVQKVYKEPGRRFTEVSIILLCFGAICAYMVLVSQIVRSILFSFGIGVEGDETTRILIVVALLLLIWFPLCIPEEITALRYGAMMSVVGMIYVTVLVAIQTPEYISNNPDIEKQIQWFKIDWSFFDAVGIAVFAYDGIQNIPIIYGELQYRSVRRVKKVLLRGTTMLALLYCALGVLGYISYVYDIPNLIIFRPTLGGINKSEDWPMVAGRFMVCIYLNMAIPLNLNPLRKSIEFFITGQHDFSNRTRYYLITIGCLVLTAIVATVMPDAVFYFKILGGLLVCPLAFLLPAILYWKLKPHDAFNVFLMGIGIIMALVGFACVGNTVAVDILGFKTS